MHSIILMLFSTRLLIPCIALQGIYSNMFPPFCHSTHHNGPFPFFIEHHKQFPEPNTVPFSWHASTVFAFIYFSYIMVGAHISCTILKDMTKRTCSDWKVLRNTLFPTRTFQNNEVHEESLAPGLRGNECRLALTNSHDTTLALVLHSSFSNLRLKIWG